MTILIVDDSRDTRCSVQILLEFAGFGQIHTAGSAREAFDQLDLAGASANPPSIEAILMDINMPQLNGVEACRRIKAEERLRDIPIIMVTGRAEDEDLELAFAAGAMDYLIKPFRTVELFARLRSALALKNELSARKARERDLLEATHQLQEANRTLRELSNRDPLTGIGNRRWFDSQLAQEWGRAQREGSSLAVVLVDVDHFKAFNDYYGHPQGDECLRQVAQALGSQLRRPTDRLARYGGEEFVILLPQVPLEGGLTVAEALRRRVEEMRLPHARSPQRQYLTISLGVSAQVPGRLESPQQLVKLADQALYVAKHAGRNCVKTVDALQDLIGASLQVGRN